MATVQNLDENTQQIFQTEIVRREPLEVCELEGTIEEVYEIVGTITDCDD